MKLIKTILTCGLLIFSICASANNQEKLDSLYNAFLNSENDSLKNSVVNHIESVLQSYGKDTIVLFWNQLAETCEKNENYNDAADLYYKTARELTNNGDYYRGYEAYLKSVDNYRIGHNIRGLAKVNNALGILFKNLNKPTESIQFYNESAKYYQAINDTLWVGKVYMNLGGMWEEQNKLDSAMYYLKTAEKILKENQDDNLLDCYINLGIVYEKEEDFSQAMYYFSKSYEISRYMVELTDKFNGNYYLGKYYFEQNRTDSAKTYLLQARQIVEDSRNQNILSVKILAEFYHLLGLFYNAINEFENASDCLIESIDYDAKNKIEEASSRIDFEYIQKSKLEAARNKKRQTTIIGVILTVLLLTLMFLVIIYRNYQHKQRANKLLTEMDELKTRLYSNITHELRTPLTLILGPLEQMLSSETEKKPSRKQVKMMRKNANSLLNLVNQMLDLSKIDANSVKLDLVEEDINKFLRRHFAAFASSAEQKSIQFEIGLLKEENIRIFDADKLEKVINNLVSNAIKYTPKNGEVRCIADFPEENLLKLIIQDTGSGIPSYEINKIFDRYHQIKSSENMHTIGTGIGLSLTKELVTIMQGNIQVESEINVGTKFTVTIPLGTEHLSADEYHLIKRFPNKESKPKHEPVEIYDSENYDDPGTEITGEDKPHVLVVDDHEEIRNYIADSLKDNFIIYTASNGIDGLNKALKQIPDLVITDVVMGETDGITLCKQLKADEKTSHIPVIILTGKSGNKDKIQGIESGADAYLTKPFSVKELQLRVHKLIEQRRKLRERFTRDLKLEPKDIAVTSADEKFLNRAMEIIEKNIGNAEFEVRQFQEEMFMSRMQLFRKIKALTNQTPGEFIRTIRLKRAASLMRQNFGNIAQITFEVGFNNPSYFAKCFKDLYGKLPSEYLKDSD